MTGIKRIAESIQAIKIMQRHLTQFSGEDFEKCYRVTKNDAAPMYVEFFRLTERVMETGRSDYVERLETLTEKLRAIALHEMPR